MFVCPYFMFLEVQCSVVAEKNLLFCCVLTIWFSQSSLLKYESKQVVITNGDKGKFFQSYFKMEGSHLSHVRVQRSQKFQNETPFPTKLRWLLLDTLEKCYCQSYH